MSNNKKLKVLAYKAYENLKSENTEDELEARKADKRRWKVLKVLLLVLEKGCVEDVEEQTPIEGRLTDSIELKDRETYLRQMCLNCGNYMTMPKDFIVKKYGKNYKKCGFYIKCECKNSMRISNFEEV